MGKGKGLRSDVANFDENSDAEDGDGVVQKAWIRPALTARASPTRRLGPCGRCALAGCVDVAGWNDGHPRSDDATSTEVEVEEIVDAR